MDRDETIDAYCAAWGEANPARRDLMLKPIWADGATYTDPTAHAATKGELVEHIGKVLARYPGSRIVRTTAVDAHHAVARFAWKMVLADGSSLPEGIDFAEFSGNGRISRIVGFFGPLRQS